MLCHTSRFIFGVITIMVLVLISIQSATFVVSIVGKSSGQAPSTFLESQRFASNQYDVLAFVELGHLVMPARRVFLERGT